MVWYVNVQEIQLKQQSKTTQEVTQKLKSTGPSFYQSLYRLKN